MSRASSRLPVPPPRPLLACGAEQKSTFCVARGARAWVGHHIGDLEHYATLARIPRRDRAFRAPVRGRAGAGGSRSSSRTTSRPRTRSSETASSSSGCSTTTPTSPPALPSTASTGRRSARSTTGPATAPTGRSGAARSSSAACAGSRAPPASGRYGCPGARRRFASPGGWPARGSPRPSAGPSRYRGRWAVSSTRHAGIRLRRSVAASSSRPSRPASAGSSTRWRRCAGCSPTRATRARLRSSSRRRPPPATMGPTISLSPTAQAGCSSTPARRSAASSDLDAGVDPGIVSARFHSGLASSTAAACLVVAQEHALAAVALSGGVFQNLRLLETVADLLREASVRVLVPRQLPVNDGGISYGQAAVAAALSAEEGL